MFKGLMRLLFAVVTIAAASPAIAQVMTPGHAITGGLPAAARDLGSPHLEQAQYIPTPWRVNKSPQVWNRPVYRPPTYQPRRNYVRRDYARRSYSRRSYTRSNYRRSYGGGYSAPTYTPPAYQYRAYGQQPSYTYCQSYTLNVDGTKHCF